MITTASAVDRLLDDGSGRRPRADARRNVERLVAAARAAAAEIGGEVTAHQIAHRAGVGIGTFYRRVGTLEALLEAVLDEIFDEIIAKADEGLAAEDPWAGFASFAMAYIRLRNELCDINEKLGDVVGERRADLRDRMRRLTGRAQRAGAMRRDVTWQDVAFLLVGAATSEHTLGLRAGPEQWERNLQVTLDGLRGHELGELPGKAPR